MFEFSAEHSLALNKNKRYYDIAYDGQKIYICTDEQQIIVLDRDYNVLQQLISEHSYYTFCYDESAGGFWAASADAPGTLFQLSDSLAVVNQITLEDLTVEYLFYNGAAKCLMAADKGKIYAIAPSGEYQLATEISNMAKSSLKCSLAGGNFLCLSMQKRGPHLSLLSFNTGNILVDTALFTGFFIKSMVVIPSASAQSGYSVLFLGIRQNDFPHIIEIVDKPESHPQTAPPIPKPEEQDYPDRNYPNPNYPEQDYPAPDSPVPPPAEHYQYCTRHCCCRQCYYRSRADVMESIALTEASIAHILNAEGEKLQKAIASASDVSELLQVNESVVKTIIHSTHLEQALFNKLSVLLQEEDCDCPCDCPCDCHCNCPCNNCCCNNCRCDSHCDYVCHSCQIPSCGQALNMEEPAASSPTE